MKPKAKTHLERMGFVDDDLKTKKHDEIMFWLMEKDNMVEVLRKAFMTPLVGNRLLRECELGDVREHECKFDWRNFACSLSCDKAKVDKEAVDRLVVSYKDARRYVNSVVNDDEKIKQIEKGFIAGIKLEVPVVTTSGYLIGFRDCVVELREYSTLWNRDGFSLYCKINNDFKKYFKWYGDTYMSLVNIEIKTRIDSIGELIRQINTYRQYVSGPWIVVAPVEGIEPILKSQGIRYYKYEG